MNLTFGALANARNLDKHVFSEVFLIDRRAREIILEGTEHRLNIALGHKGR
jgi:hypothetical protein